MRARPFQLGLGARDLRLVRPRVNDEEHVTLMHRRALGEGHALHEARDPRPNLYRIDGLEVPRELVFVGDVAYDYRSDRDLGHDGWRGLRLPARRGEDQRA